VNDDWQLSRRKKKGNPKIVVNVILLKNPHFLFLIGAKNAFGFKYDSGDRQILFNFDSNSQK
jgi:hypothetical protein